MLEMSDDLRGREKYSALENTMRRHLSILSVIYIVLGLIGLYLTIKSLPALLQGSQIPEVSLRRIARGFGRGLAFAFLGSGVWLISLGVAGIGLIRRRKWGRLLALATGTVGLLYALLSAAIFDPRSLIIVLAGAPLGLYSLWVLRRQDVVRSLQ